MGATIRGDVAPWWEITNMTVSPTEECGGKGERNGREKGFRTLTK